MAVRKTRKKASKRGLQRARGGDIRLPGSTPHGGTPIPSSQPVIHGVAGAGGFIEITFPDGGVVTIFPGFGLGQQPR